MSRLHSRRRVGYPQWDDEALVVPFVSPSPPSIQNGYWMSTAWPHRYDGHPADVVVEFGNAVSVATMPATMQERKRRNKWVGWAAGDAIVAVARDAHCCLAP